MFLTVISVCQINPKLSHSLNALTESKVPTISRVLDKVILTAGNAASTSSNKKRLGTLPEHKLKQYLYFLFPDAEEEQV